MQNHYQFVKPRSIEETLALLQKHGGEAALIAGGTDLMIEMRGGTRRFSYLFDIGALSELRYISEDTHTVRIGAASTFDDCINNEALEKAAPILVEACGWVGSPQIRNRGTIGGNIVTAAACADTVPALVALDARCVLQSGRGSRELKVTEFITGPNKTVIRPDEILTEIFFRKPNTPSKSCFLKLIRRNALAKSRLTIAVIARQSVDGRVDEIRIAGGSITPVPCRFSDAEDLLTGAVPDANLVERAAEIISAYMLSITGYRWSTEYKKPVVEALAVRALVRVLGVNQ